MATSYGKWTIIEALSEGGQAHTFTCYSVDDPSRTVHVLKRLKNLRRIDRFISEVDVVSKIQNPYVVRIVDFDTEAEKPYLVMSYYSKGTLAKLPLSELSLADRLELFTKLCRGVRCAHNFGFDLAGNPVWRIFVCDYCGNTQIFRPDYVPGKKNPWVAGAPTTA